MQLFYRILGSRYWLLFGALLLCLFGLVVASPNWFLLGTIFKGFVHVNWDTIIFQAHDIRYPMTLSPDLHDAKTALRLTLPLFVKLTGSNIRDLYIIQVILMICGFLLLLRELFSITHDRLHSLGIGLLWAGSYACYSGLLDIIGWGDAYAHFFLVVALCSRSPALIAISLILASFTDEFAFVNSSFILLYHGIDFKSMRISVNKSAMAVVVSWFVYLGLRFVLYRWYGLYTPTGMVGLDVIFDNIHLLPLGLVTGIKSLWWLIVVPVFLMRDSKQYLIVGAILFALIVSFICSIMVYDVSRSVSYMFPAALLGVKILYDQKKEALLISRLPWLILFAALFPSFYIIKGLVWIKPLPIYLIYAWMGKNSFFY